MRTPNYSRELIKRCNIAGITFHDAELLWDELEVRTELALVRHKNNRYDKNAVAVVLYDDYDEEDFDFEIDDILGYIPRTENAEIAAMLDKGMGDELECEISRIGETYECKYIEVSIYRRDSVGKWGESAVNEDDDFEDYYEEVDADEYDGYEMFCPCCGGRHIITGKQGANIKAMLIGARLFGAVGAAIFGRIGKNCIAAECLECGTTWKI